jgi:hypothetical protein
MTTNASALVVPPSARGTNDIRPPTAPVYIPDPWVWFWWVLLAVLALAAWLGWRFWRKTPATLKLPPPIPPHEKARRKLQEALTLIHDPKPFCILVSDTLRLYLEERFEWRAPERTTEEFLFELAGADRLDQGQKDLLAEFLRQCDLVKFARYEPPQTELRALHGAASRLVDETEPPPPKPEELLPAAAPKP